MKVVFKKMKIEDAVDLIEYFYFNNEETMNSNSFLFSYYPELNEIDKNKDVHSQIESIIKNRFKKFENDIETSIDYYSNLWNKYNDLYFNVLNKYLNTNFYKEEITAYVGLIPIFPRYLESFSFAFCPNLDDKKIIETIAHETCHFAWFKKFKSMYPNINESTFENPHIEWKLSEMVVDPILNSKEVQSVFNELFKERAYDNFYSITYKDKNVMKELINIFNKEDKIEEKIKTSYEYIKEVFKEGE